MPNFLMARQPVDGDEGKRILRLAGARHALADRILRAGIVTLGWESLRVPQVAARAGCDAKTVRAVAFNEEGVDGLGDRPGCGRKRRITEAERSRIVALVRLTPPGHLETQPTVDLWAAERTLDALAAKARRLGIRVSRSQVRRILLAEGVRRRRTRSRDFAGKETDRRAPYQPARGVTFVCADELDPVNPRAFPSVPGWSSDGHRIRNELDYGPGPEKTWAHEGLLGLCEPNRPLAATRSSMGCRCGAVSFRLPSAKYRAMRARRCFSASGGPGGWP